MAQMNLLKSADIKAAANVQSERVVAMLRQAGKLVPPEGKIVVSVGFSAAYALYLHEKKEMKWKGLPRGSMGGRKAKRRLSQEDVTRVRVLKGAIRFAKNEARYRDSEQRADAAGPIQSELKSLIEQRKVVSKRGAIHRGLYWDPQGMAQPQFLVGPFREMRKELGDIVRTVATKSGSLEKGLIVAGLRLQREAQRRVPVEFGFLKASAFTVVSR